MKIYDCFNFFNELDILELRLNILSPYVDYFVIVESSVKHNGEPKPFFYEENQERFSQFKDKIILYKVYDTPTSFTHLPQTQDKELQKIYHFITQQSNRFDRNTQPDYGRDFFQKECIRRPLIGCSDEDIIIFSDADEIPNPEVLGCLNHLDLTDKRYALIQNMYCYYLNVLKETSWSGSKISSYKNLKNISLNELRGDPTYSNPVQNGGWHFSFIGGADMVKTKITSYSARDLVSEVVLTSIENNIKGNIDPFFRQTLRTVPLDGTFPKYLLDNIEKYKKFLRDIE